MVNGQVLQLRGANFANAPVRYGSGQPRFDWENDYAQLASAHANHARVDLIVSWWELDQTRFFQTMDDQIARARANGIYIVPNVHWTPSGCVEDYVQTCPIWGDPSEQDRLRNFWIAFAQRYKNETMIAGYDILNEPTPSNMTSWWTLAGRLRQDILNVDPNHLIFIESGSNGTFAHSMGSQVVYSVHFYDALSQLAAEVAPVFNSPMYVGEWGHKTDYSYLRAVGIRLNQLGVSHAQWCWRYAGHIAVGPSTGPFYIADQQAFVILSAIWSGATS